MTETHEFSTYPQLVIGLAFRGDHCPEHQFLPGREFTIIDHQSGGVACLHPRILGTVLTIKPDKLSAMRKLCDTWYGTDTGACGTTLDSLSLYRNQLLNTLNVDCNDCYSKFVEAWYPVDVPHVRELTSDVLPDDLDDLIDWSKSPERVFGIVGRWSLVILGENSD